MHCISAANHKCPRGMSCDVASASTVPRPSYNELRDLMRQYDDGDLRLLKVKQPWAGLLVLGLKTIENRSWRLSDSAGRWILVVASSPPPSQAALSDMRDRLKRCGHKYEAVQQSTALATYRAIIGAIRLKDTSRAGVDDNVWYNPPDWAWQVDRAVAFGDMSITLAPEDRMQTQVSSKKRRMYADQLRQLFQCAYGTTWPIACSAAPPWGGVSSPPRADGLPPPSLGNSDCDYMRGN